MSKHRTATLITVAIALDWLPSQILGEGSLITSATKLVVPPLVFVDFLRDPRSYARVSYASFYLVGLLLGTGGGVATGVVGFRSTLWALLPNVAILMYYLKPRSWRDTRGILRVATASSTVVPIWLILARLGIVDPYILAEGPRFYRVFAGPSRSSLGLLLAFIPATLGGLLLAEVGIQKLVLAICLIALSLFAPLVTVQRASNLVVWTCLGFATIASFHHSESRQWLKYLVVLFVLSAAIWVLWGRGLEPYVQPLILRLQGYGEATRNTEYRVRMYEVFWAHLVSSPSLIATGHGPAYASVGTTYHFIVGEAYALGGLFLSSVLFVGLILSAGRLIVLWVRGSEGQGVVLALLCLFIGFLINQSTHAGLNVRVVYMLLGLWLSVGRVDSEVSDGLDSDVHE